MPERGIQALPLAGTEPVRRCREVVHPHVRRGDLLTRCFTAARTGVPRARRHRQRFPVPIFRPAQAPPGGPQMPPALPVRRSHPPSPPTRKRRSGSLAPRRSPCQKCTLVMCPLALPAPDPSRAPRPAPTSPRSSCRRPATGSTSCTRNMTEPEPDLGCSERTLAGTWIGPGGGLPPSQSPRVGGRMTDELASSYRAYEEAQAAANAARGSTQRRCGTPVSRARRKLTGSRPWTRPPPWGGTGIAPRCSPPASRRPGRNWRRDDRPRPDPGGDRARRRRLPAVVAPRADPGAYPATRTRARSGGRDLGD
jgi:hypothetical protein